LVSLVLLPSPAERLQHPALLCLALVPMLVSLRELLLLLLWTACMDG
jgi:hypothetical protein